MDQSGASDIEIDHANSRVQRRRRRRSSGQTSRLPASSPEQGESPARVLDSADPFPVESDKPGHFSLAGAGIYSFARMVVHCGKSSGGLISAERLQTITHLDLSRNRLESLEGVEQLPHLIVLDARHNQIPSLFCAAVPLGQCPRLERLYIQHQGSTKTEMGPASATKDSAANASGSNNWAMRPEKYVDPLCRELPTLIEVDGISNPRPLREEQLEQAASLEDNFGVLRSQIANIDLRDRDFGPKQFMQLLGLLNGLPVRRLHLSDGNPEILPIITNYWFEIVLQLPSLIELDGKAVTELGRNHAKKTGNKLRQIFEKYESDVNRMRLQDEISPGDYTISRLSLTAESGNEMSDAKSESENWLQFSNSAWRSAGDGAVPDELSSASGVEEVNDAGVTSRPPPTGHDSYADSYADSYDGAAASKPNMETWDEQGSITCNSYSASSNNPSVAVEMYALPSRRDNQPAANANGDTRVLRGILSTSKKRIGQSTKSVMFEDEEIAKVGQPAAREDSQFIDNDPQENGSSSSRGFFNAMSSRMYAATMRWMAMKRARFLLYIMQDPYRAHRLAADKLPQETISGRLSEKTELLLTFLQISGLIFSISVTWPSVWDSFYNSFTIELVLRRIFGPNFILLSSDGDDDNVSEGARALVFMTAIFLPLLIAILYVFYGRDSRDQRLSKNRIQSTMSTMSKRMSASKLSFWQRMKYYPEQWFSLRWPHIVQFFCLFLLTAIYLPVSRVCFECFRPVENDDGDLVVSAFPSSAWPGRDGVRFTFMDHWFMFFAAYGILAYTIGIPVIVIILVYQGSKEVEGQYSLDKMDDELKEAQRNLANCQDSRLFSEHIEIVRKKKIGIFFAYAQAIREYTMPQTYLYQSYRRPMKYYKVLVMLYKVILLLGLSFITKETSASNLDEDDYAVRQSGLAFAVVLTGLAVAYFGRPHQASNENIVDIMFWGTNSINAFLTLLLALDAIQPSSTVSALIILPNVIALSTLIGVTLAVPYVNNLGNVERDREYEKDVHVAAREGDVEMAYGYNANELEDFENAFTDINKGQDLTNSNDSRHSPENSNQNGKTSPSQRQHRVRRQLLRDEPVFADVSNTIQNEEISVQSEGYSYDGNSFEHDIMTWNSN